MALGMGLAFALVILPEVVAKEALRSSLIRASARFVCEAKRYFIDSCSYIVNGGAKPVMSILSVDDTSSRSAALLIVIHTSRY
ncbi:hypothetical protein H4582DRAFT_1979207 [Lactarius indigo]|nr:hypothetical protein H4582DRAFT_1979207 [Lactarius indigo]